MKRMTKRILPVLFALGMGAASAAYPERPITIVVPFAPGGAMDTTARLLAEPLAERLGQPVLVENKSGATGSIGTMHVARSAPDGYTMLFTNQGPNVVREILYPETGYRTLRDFSPISTLSVAPLVAVVSGKSDIRTLDDLLRFGKDPSKRLNFGTTGVGSPAHIAAESLRVASGTEIAHIPYGGASRIVTALLGNEVQLAFLAPSDALPHVNSNALRAIAVTTEERFVLAPNVPTLKEQGFPGVGFDMWYSLLVPANTPAPIIEKLNSAVVDVLNMESIKERLLQMGFSAEPSTPQRVVDRLRADRTMFERIIKEANIQPE